MCNRNEGEKATLDYVNRERNDRVGDDRGQDDRNVGRR